VGTPLIVVVAHTPESHALAKPQRIRPRDAIRRWNDRCFRFVTPC
jgi:hypothetical protein